MEDSMSETGWMDKKEAAEKYTIHGDMIHTKPQLLARIDDFGVRLEQRRRQLDNSKSETTREETAHAYTKAELEQIRDQNIQHCRTIVRLENALRAMVISYHAYVDRLFTREEPEDQGYRDGERLG